MTFAEIVYESLCGELLCGLAEIENAFDDGKPCEKWYCEMLDAYERLLTRLNEEEFDPDAEIMIDSLLRIQKELCLRMYSYGAKYGEQEVR